VRHNKFKAALELFGDMLNQEADRLNSTPDTMIAKVMEYGPNGAAIRGEKSTTPLLYYRWEPDALLILQGLGNISMKSRNAIVAKHVYRNLRTDRDRAEECECQESTYRTRLKRGYRSLNKEYKELAK